MIAEDYVSLEVAKLLEQAGFNAECNHAYFNGTLVDYTMFGFCLGGELINAPTIQMVAKWLREVHRLHISIQLAYSIPRAYEACIMRTDICNDVFLCPEQDFKTYDAAYNAALKYCLEYIINSNVDFKSVDLFVTELEESLKDHIANKDLDAWFFNDFKDIDRNHSNAKINKYLNDRIPGTWIMTDLFGNGTDVGEGVFYESKYNLKLFLSCLDDEDEDFIDNYEIMKL